MILTSRRLEPECASDFELDQLEDLPDDRRNEIRGHLSSCTACASRNDELATERQRFEREAPPLRLSQPKLRPRAGAGYRMVAFSGVALAAAATAMIVIRSPTTIGPSPTSTHDHVQIKGSPYELSAIVERGSHQFRLSSSDVVAPGDRLQLSYSTAQGVFLYVVGVDGTGRPARYFPDKGGSARVEEGRDVELAFSLVLDDAPGPERFYGFFCDREVEGDGVERRAVALATTGASDPLRDCEEIPLELQKR